MTIGKNRRTYIAIALGALTLGAGVFVGTRIAQADGVPQTQPLTYSGTLLDAAGNPATGMVNIDLNLHTAPTGGSLACATSGQVTLNKGRFQLVLDPTCTTAVHATPDLFIDFKVNGASVFTTRPRLGAVPYALEADTARVAYRGLYENPTTATQSTEGGGYCGVTAQSYSGAAVGGYTGGKTKCQAACGGSGTAHICSSEEMVRYAATGGTHPTIANAWIANGAWALATSGITINDCSGFTTAQPTDAGSTWAWGAVGSPGSPDAQGCATVHPIACCD